MFRKLIVENYKSWAGPHEVDLAPLTLIYGPNSSGKSSLLQPLLLLKQTFEAASPKIHLNLGGPNDLVSVGSLESLVHREQKPKPEHQSAAVSFGCELDAPVGTPQKSDVISGPIAYKATFGEVAGVVAVTHLTMSTELVNWGHQEWVIDRDPNGAYSVHHPVFANHQLKQEKASSAEPRRAIPDLGLTGFPSNVIPPEVAMSVTLQLAFEKLRYIGPVRLPPQRSYRASEIEASAGTRGERAIVPLLRGVFVGERLARLGKWIEALGLGDSVSISDPDGDAVKILIRRDGVDANLADVGYGVGQVLPLLASILGPYEYDSTLIIEEPESHLHPYAQKEFGDLIVEAVSSGTGDSSDDRQLIIETHSEDLLQRIQLRMAEGKLTPDQVAIYRCSRGNDGASKLDRLVVDEFGRIKNWPENFFGDPIKDSFDQVRAMLNRRSGENNG